MKCLNTTASITFAVLALGTTKAFALSAYTKEWVFFPMETADCELREGKTMDDYAEVMRKFENFLRNDLGVTSSEAISVEPYYYGDDGHYSLSYWNYWPNGSEMGDYSTKWTGSYQAAPTPKGLAVVGPYEKTVKCDNHKSWSVALVRKPKTQKVTKRSMLVVQACRTGDDASMDKIREGVQALSKEMERRKYENGMWIKFLAWGASKDDPDFKLITRYDSFDALGNAWDIYAPVTKAWAEAKRIGDEASFSCKVEQVDFVTPRHMKAE